MTVCDATKMKVRIKSKKRVNKFRLLFVYYETIFTVAFTFLTPFSFTIKQLASTTASFSFSHILVGDKPICAAASSPDTAKSAAWSSGYSTGLMINMVSVQNPLAPFCCVLGKDTLRRFPLLGGLDKQF